MSRRQWLQQYTSSDYMELLAMSMSEPIGSDRLFMYLALICAGLSGNRGDFEALMFVHQDQSAKLQEWIDKTRAAQNGINSES